jgi:hypothetical protein
MVELGSGSEIGMAAVMFTSFLGHLVWRYTQQGWNGSDETLRRESWALASLHFPHWHIWHRLFFFLSSSPGGHHRDDIQRLLDLNMVILITRQYRRGRAERYMPPDTETYTHKTRMLICETLTVATQETLPSTC